MSHRIMRVVVLLVGAILAVQVAPIAAAAGSLPTIVAVAAGNSHTCVLMSAGGVKCWGENGNGQLGNGTRTPSSFPVDVSGLGHGVMAIATGAFHSCALTSAGTVKCWGATYEGQIRSSPSDDVLVPVDIPRLAGGVTAIAAGASNTCALNKLGWVKCWGADPLRISGVKAVTAGGTQICVLTIRGGVRCWGANPAGQLGNGTRISSRLPVSVVGLSRNVAAIAAGWAHSCALANSGAVRCWGANGSGQLGNAKIPRDDPYSDIATDRGHPVPVVVSGLSSGITAIAAGGGHTCALLGSGRVQCWGENFEGELGSPTSGYLAVDVEGLPRPATAIAAGGSHTCALLVGGGVECWGYNGAGQLGNESMTKSWRPIPVDFRTHQTIVVQATIPAGAIATGTVAKFDAMVQPVASGRSRAIVRFVVVQRLDGVWRQIAQRSVFANSGGRAILTWTFARAGSWYVRAKALKTTSFLSSSWSPRFRYTVR